jgi:GntR family transcriptional repressor for pyruvate dehydrogenase complex
VARGSSGQEATATERGTDRPDRARKSGVKAARLAVQRVQPSYVQVAAQLRALVLGHQLRPGERLPAEGELSAMFGVSRSTTREALRLLAAENIIETRRGVTGGSFVVHPHPDSIELALSTALHLSAGGEHISHEEVYQVWQIMHVPTARLAATGRTDEDVERLMALSEPASADETDNDLTLRAIEFHRAVLGATSNRLLQIVARPLAALSADTLVGMQDVHPFLVETMDRHRTIALAIAARDEEASSRLMAEDMAIPGHRRVQQEEATRRGGVRRRR